LEYEIIEQIKKDIPKNEFETVLSSTKTKPKKVKSQTNTVIKLKAKDFMLQFNPTSNILKIGFGQYFYVKKNQIKISEEFTGGKLSEIMNLQINEKKRTVELDAVFKKMQTHFNIKEMYEGTLDIMKFIQSYNKTPFTIDSKYKDEISVVIDKDGFNLSFCRPKRGKSVFWNMGTHDENMILDGEEWIFEAVMNGRYHFITKNSSNVYDGKEYAELCNFIAQIYNDKTSDNNNDLNTKNIAGVYAGKPICKCIELI